MKSRFLQVALCVSFSLVVTPATDACDSSDDIDFSKTAALSKKTNRPLLLAFLGTDWSISSLKLDREIFDQAEFADDSKYNFLLCKLHFYQTQERSPEIIRQNEQLALQYHIVNFPTVIVLSPSGAELGRFGYLPGGVQKFANAVNALLIKGRPAGD